MKIRKLTASFGKLEHESLSFHEGLNPRWFNILFIRCSQSLK